MTQNTREERPRTTPKDTQAVEARYADRQDLAGLDATELCAVGAHPPIPGFNRWFSDQVTAVEEGRDAAEAAVLLVDAVCSDVGVGDYEARLERLTSRIETLIRANPETYRELVELSEFRATEETPHKDVWAHTMKVVANCTETDPHLRLAALLHDVGKPQTRSYQPGRGTTFDGHEVVGARMARELLERCGFDPETVEGVRSLVRLHLRPHQGHIFGDAAVRRYVFDAGPKWVSRLTRLSEADITTKYDSKRRAAAERATELRIRIAEVCEGDNRRAVRPPIDGNQVAERLGLTEGPELGRYMRALNEEAARAWARGERFDETEAWKLVESL